LGYSPEAWDAFTKALGEAIEFLEVQGLWSQREDRPLMGSKGVMFLYKVCLEEYWVLAVGF
jgi:hypothetical protein